MSSNKLALDIDDLPFGRTKAYEEITAGRLIATKFGKLTKILPENWDRYVASLPTFKPGAAS
jgi:hypothetical protein